MPMGTALMLSRRTVTRSMFRVVSVNIPGHITILNVYLFMKYEDRFNRGQLIILLKG